MAAVQPTTAAKRPASDGSPSLDRVVFGVALGAVVVFVAWGAFGSESLAAAVGSAFGWVTQALGWLFVLASTGFVALALFVAFSRYGKIRLGKDDERPEFSTGAWFSMLFAAGMGIGLVFWGVAEPLYHLAGPPMGLAEENSGEAARLALQYSVFHWGLHPWAMYAVIGLALAYAVFRKGRPSLVSSAVVPLIGENRVGVRRAVDTLAIFATVFGAATSLGLGAMQINSGLATAYGVPKNTVVGILIIGALVLLYVLSAVSGVHRGIKLVSIVNVGLAALLAAFVFLFGPTLHILLAATQSAGDYLGALLPMSFATGVDGGGDWLSGWTVFYWAWWISWSPFVGTFIARISRGRTVREFVLCVMVVPTVVSLLWFAVLGGSALSLQLSGSADLATALADNGAEGALFALLAEFPLAAVSSTLVMVLITLFFVSSADSASVVLGMLSQRGVVTPSRGIVIMWGVAIAAVAAVLMFAGGLSAMQSATILVSTPFLLVLVAVCVNLVRELRADADGSDVEAAHVRENGAGQLDVEDIVGKPGYPVPDASLSGTTGRV
jgi:glycine betaine transporter